MILDRYAPLPISRMLISVVVCTHDRLDSLHKALDSLCQLNISEHIDWEIVVVDNDSPPGIKPLVAELERKYRSPIIRYVFEPRRGIAHARQRGVEEALGTWIAFFDDDQIADPEWLNELAKLAAEKRAMCVGGQVRLTLPAERPRLLGPQCRDLLSETVAQPSSREYDQRFKPGAGNLMIHRLALERVGGFDLDAEGRGEDTILFLKILRAGYACWYTPTAIVHHVIPASRLSDESFESLIRYVSSRMPLFEKDHWRRVGLVRSAGAAGASACTELLGITFFARSRSSARVAVSILDGGRALSARISPVIHRSKAACVKLAGVSPHRETGRVGVARHARSESK